jgi:gliding motility-associated-like protein
LAAEGTGTFSWSPAEGINNLDGAQVTVYPSGTTTYKVMLSNQYCTTNDSLRITVLPYDPLHIQTIDSLCSGDSVQLSVTTEATGLVWTGENINATQTKSPTVFPERTTVYKVFANPGVCQTEDSIRVIVMERPPIFAGIDVIIEEGKEVQLTASGADTYTWHPGTGLNNTGIANPIAHVPPNFDSVVYIVTGALLNGCTDSDTIVLYINKRSFVDAPTAFTPNGDGKNDVFRPVVKGNYELTKFSVYNRWGQLVFQTVENGKGWDGRMNGMINTSNTYVWLLEARNKSTKEKVAKKGTLVLIK